MSRMTILLLAVAALANAGFVNPGFESGLASWTSLGNVQAVGPVTLGPFGPNTYNIGPYQTTMGQLSTALGAPAADIETELGLASGFLDALVLPGITNGSLLYQEVTLTPGNSTADFWWAFATADTDPFDDSAFFFAQDLVNPVLHIRKLACIVCGDALHTVGGLGGVPWEQASILLPASSYRMGFLVANTIDTMGDTFLFVDDGQGSFANVVPEPGTYALLAGGLALVALFRRRR